MKVIGLNLIASELNVFSEQINEVNKLAFAREIVNEVVNVLNHSGNQLDYLYELAAYWENKLNCAVITDIFLYIYKEVMTWAKANCIDPRMCYKTVDFLNDVIIKIDLDATFEKMKREEEETKITEVKVHDVIDNPTAEQLSKLV